MADQITLFGPRSIAAPLVGRARELALLREQLDAALAGSGRLVLIGGEAGIGKTTVAEALCGEAAERGALVLVGRCYDLTETPPYGPWAEICAGLSEGHNLPVPLGSGEAAASQSALFVRVRDALTSTATIQPLVVLLEDLHWGDRASLDLLRFLSRQLDGLRLLLLATYRDDEIAAGQPLAILLPTLVREARASRLALSRLGAADTLALVRARHHLPDRDESRLTNYLYAHAEGNPFYLGELLRSLEEAGVLVPAPTTDSWTLSDLTGARVPPLLRQVIGARIARLGKAAGRALTIAAVVGQEVPLDLWIAVSGTDEEALADLAGRAIAARVLVEMPDGQGMRFAHALVRAALYEATPLPWRRALHRRVADALLSLPNPDPDAVAHHLRWAGDERAVGWLIEAGHRAHGSFAYQAAVERYEAALALVPDGQADPGIRGWLHLRLAQVHFYSDPRLGIGYLEEAGRLAELADDCALIGYARYRLGFHLTGIGDFRRGLPAMGIGVAELNALTPADRARLAEREPHGARLGYIGTFAYRLTLVGRFADAKRWADDARVQGDEWNANFALAEVHLACGQFTAARTAAARGYATQRRAGDWFALGLYLWYELQTSILVFAADSLHERRHLAEAATTTLARGSGLGGEENPRLGHLPLLLIEGHWDEARVIMQAVVAGHRTYRPVVAGLLAQLTHRQGDDAIGIALTQEALPLGSAEEPGYVYYYPALELQRLAATRAIAAGDMPAAMAWLEAHDRWLAWSGTVLGRAESQLGWAGYHRAAGDLAAAMTHAERALAHAAEPRQPLALLAAHRLFGELATDAGQYAAAARHLDAAFTLADACAAPYERALTLLALVELRLAEGRADTAAGSLGEARAICTTLGAHPALARTEALAAQLQGAPGVPNTPASAVPPFPARLTAREIEVLRLIAAGMSIRAMAAALCRSERTIERHLENIYRKIDAHNRADATAFAFRHHLT